MSDERAIIPPIRRVGVLLAAMLLQACLGGLYAWSLGVLPMAHGARLSIDHVIAVFVTMILGFGLTAGVAWPTISRLGATRSCAVAAALMAIGPLLGQLGSYPLLVLGGGVTGVGLGFGYLAPRDMLHRWFPGRANQILVTRCLSVAFGIAVFVLAPCFQYMLDSSPRDWLLWSTVLNTLAISLAAWWLRAPTPAQAAAVATAADGLVDPAPPPRPPLSIQVVDLASFTIGSAAGVALFAVAAPLFILWGNMPRAHAALLVGLMGLMNTAGRVTWFTIAEHLGRRTALVSLLMLEAFSLWALSDVAMADQLTLHVTVCAVAFGYGGVVASAPALLTSHGLVDFNNTRGVFGLPAIFWSLGSAAAVVVAIHFGVGLMCAVMAVLCFASALASALVYPR